MASGSMGGVVGNIHVLEISNIKGGTGWKTEVARGVTELEWFASDRTKGMEGAKI